MEALLSESVAHLCARGKGILAADESPGTLGKRLKNTPQLSHLENAEETRRQWREILLTSDTGSCFGGVILHEETLLQSTKDGKAFVECLRERGILPGVKVDQGLEPVGEETVTKGLDTLSERCAAYREQGARFAKWRAALKVSDVLPSRECVEQNAEQLARYAKVCQEQGLVPIVEPEILITSDYGMARSRDVSTLVLREVFKRLAAHGVDLKTCLLKPQMVMPGETTSPPRLPLSLALALNPDGRPISSSALGLSRGPRGAGSESAEKASAQEVARATLDVFDECLTDDLAGVFFLSGGLTEEQATVNLNELNLAAKERYAARGGQPWKLSFSFGRALQASVLKMWRGRPENAEACRAQSLRLAKANSSACEGEYNPPHPSPSDAGSTLVETFRGHSGAPA